MAKRNIHKRVELFDKDDIEKHPRFHPKDEDKRLFDAIQNDTLIVFYGAGVSQLAGCAGWTGLAINIIKEIPDEIYSNQDKIILQEIAMSEPKKVISICYHKVRKYDDLLNDVYYKIMRDSVRPQDYNEFIKIHKKIFDLNAISYVTTNIDKGIESPNHAGLRDLRNRNIIDLTDDALQLDPLQEIRFFCKCSR